MPPLKTGMAIEDVVSAKLVYDKRHAQSSDWDAMDGPSRPLMGPGDIWDGNQN